MRALSVFVLLFAATSPLTAQAPHEAPAPQQPNDSPGEHDSESRDGEAQPAGELEGTQDEDSRDDDAQPVDARDEIAGDAHVESEESEESEQTGDAEGDDERAVFDDPTLGTWEPEVAVQPAPDPDGPFAGGPRLHWHPTWRRTGALDYTLIGISLALTVAAEVLGPLREDNPWNSVSSVDTAVRDGLATFNESRRGRLRDASDILLSVTVSYPFIMDGIVSALWYHQSPDVGRELALISLEVQFVSAALNSVAKVVGSRTRPYAQRCGTGELPADDGDCTGSNRIRSFYSGHASQSFASAAATCVFHARLPLYGGGVPDGLACGGALALATTVGALRIAADMHYFTDVLTGAIVGTAVGTLIPLLRMRRPSTGRTIGIAPNGLGLSVFGSLR